MDIERSNKTANVVRSYIVTIFVALSLHINSFKPKWILMDYTINTPIARATKCYRHFVQALPITHREQQTQNNSFKLRWTHLTNAIQ